MNLLQSLLTGVLMGTVLLTGATPMVQAAQGDLAPDLLSGKPEQVVRLANGLSVLVLKDARFPLVSTRLYVGAGSTYEKPEEAGISHVLEHMVFKGTTTRPKNAISQEVEAAGGYLNAATSYDYTVYITDMPDRHWKLGMDVVRDMAFNPSLDPAELESEKDVIVAELKRGEDDPGSRMFKNLISRSLQGTTYEHPVIGFEKTVRSLTVQNLRDYIARYYQPQNMLLVVVGNVEPTDVLAEAERQFGSYRNTSALPERLPLEVQKLPLSNKTPVVVEPGPWNKVYLAAALPVPGSASYQSVSLDALAYLLGGDRTSLFYRTFKYERQLVDSIHVSNIGFEGVGLFLVMAELNADKVGQFWKELAETFSGLKATNFTEQELERARLNLEDSLYRSKETLPGLASKLGFFQFFLGGEQGERNTVEAIRNVNATALQAVLDTWIHPDRLTATVLSPEGAAIPDLNAILASSWKGDTRSSGMTEAETGKTEIVQLGEGRTVVLIPDATLPYFSMNLAFSGGETLLDPSEQGLAALTSSVLTKETARYNASELQAFLSDRAASLGASSGMKRFTVSLTGPSRFNEDLFGLLKELVQNPVFSAEETARSVHDQIAAIRSREDQPLELAFRRLMPFLFPHSPCGYLQLGEIADVEKYTQDNVRSYWNRQKTRPWVLAIAGQFNREEVLNLARALPVPASPMLPPQEPQWTTEKALDIPMPDRKQAHLMLVFRTAPDTSPDAPTLNLLETTLSGMGGPLFRELRDRQGLGYTVTAFGQQNDELGMLVFYIGTEPDKLAQAEEGFRKIIADLQQNLLPASELNRGKNQLEGDYYRGLQSLGARAREAASLTLAGRPLSFTRDQIERSKDVTPEQIREIAKKYLIPGSEYTIKVLP